MLTEFKKKSSNHYGRSNLPISVFAYLLQEGWKQLVNPNNESLSLKWNDVEPFHSLSAEPHMPLECRKGIEIFKDLI